jgi:hypothetical protein
VRIRLELLGGFPAHRDPLPEARVALLVDATASMRAGTDAGPARVIGARAAAERFAASLPLQTPLSLWVLGDDPGARCDAALEPLDGERDELLRAVRRLRARGEGSLAAALRELPGPDEGGYERVVAVSALDDGCGGDLCAAARDLVARGVRLDVVHIGSAPAPDCLADVTHGEPEGPPVPWPTAAPVRFHVERRGADPAILVCGESGGLPVEVGPGSADVVVNLDPPLRVPRDFVAGTRWVLQVLDFPGLDPPERLWRWQAESPPPLPETGVSP